MNTKQQIENMIKTIESFMNEKDFDKFCKIHDENNSRYTDYDLWGVIESGTSIERYLSFWSDKCEDCPTPNTDDYKENDIWICGKCNRTWGLRYSCISGPRYIWMTADES